MKRWLIAVMAVVMTVSFASCSDDDKDNPDGSINLLGTWDVIENEGDGYLDETVFVFLPDNTIKIIYDEDGTCDYGTYKISGNELTVKFVLDYPIYWTGKISKSGNKVNWKMTWDDEKYDLTLVKR